MEKKHICLEFESPIKLEKIVLQRIVEAIYAALGHTLTIIKDEREESEAFYVNGIRVVMDKDKGPH